MFEKTLSDLIKGIRSHKSNESKYISQSITEIKQELQRVDMHEKANAVQKVTYLFMIGYEVSWASFHVVEVMSGSKFFHKRVGYLAAGQTFNANTEVLMLCTNLFKKDFVTKEFYVSGLALNVLSKVCTVDLARDLVSDVVTMLSSSRPYIRKKAVICLYRMVLQYPDALRPSFQRLKDKFEDENQSVVSAVVSVVCELARKNPQNYLALAPLFFKLLTTSKNNWLLIKVVKLFGALTPLEPRLAKKLVEPLTSILTSGPVAAMSLVYECILCVVNGMKDHIGIIKICIEKLRSFIENSDPNLKYLGLVALEKLMKAHPKAVSENRDVVILCLDDPDTTICEHALELLSGMVSKKNLKDVINNLVLRLRHAEGSFHEKLIAKIIDLCSMKTYALITDFQWYLCVLVELSNAGTQIHGDLIAHQFTDIMVRVNAIRPYGVPIISSYLGNTSFLNLINEENNLDQIVGAAAYVSGEFCSFLDNPIDFISYMVNPKVLSLPGWIQGLYLQNSVKIFAWISGLVYLDRSGVEQNEEIRSRFLQTLEDRAKALVEAQTMLNDNITKFTQSPHLDVQERGCFFTQLLNIIKENTDTQVLLEISELFSGDLNPVAAKAQRKVPIPDNTDLDSWIYKPVPDEKEVEDLDVLFIEEEQEALGNAKPAAELTEEEIQEKTAERKQRQSSDPFYLEGKLNKKKLDEDFGSEDKVEVDLDDIPVVTLLPGDLGEIHKKKSKLKVQYEIAQTEEMPEGMRDSDEEKTKDDNTGQTGGSDNFVDLFSPLKAGEELPNIQRYHEKKRSSESEKKEEDKSKKHHKHHHHHKKHKHVEQKPVENDLIDFGGEEDKPEEKPVETEKPKKKHNHHKKHHHHKKDK